MAEQKDSLLHLASSDDLVTSHEATRAGFVAIALTKNDLATPALLEAKALLAITRPFNTPVELMESAEARKPMLTAAGVSDKAASHLPPADQAEVIKVFVENFLVPAGDEWPEELVYRFLIGKGDALGGKVRNAVGEMAKAKLTKAMLAGLAVRGVPFEWLDGEGKKPQWMSGPDYPAIEHRLKAVAWTFQNQRRLLAYNVKVPLVDKNIDIVVMNVSPTTYTAASKRTPQSYVGLGELKGGIDPAGSDEHWKTARSALSTARSKFAAAECHPYTCFVGAAIVKSMAEELWSQIGNGQLAYAANLTNDDQVASFVQWLIVN